MNQPEIQKHLITGTVSACKYAKHPSGRGTSRHFQITSATSGAKFNGIADFFCPLENRDAIIATVYKDGNTLTMIKRPKLMIPVDRQTVMETFMSDNFKAPRVTPKIAEGVYEMFRTLSGVDIPKKKLNENGDIVSSNVDLRSELEKSVSDGGNQPLVDFSTVDHHDQSKIDHVPGTNSSTTTDPSKVNQDGYIDINSLTVEERICNTIDSYIHSWNNGAKIPEFVEQTGASRECMKKIMRIWVKKRIVRPLYMLGLNNKEIRETEMTPMELLYRVKHNPYPITSIPIEKCHEIKEQLDLHITKEELECSFIVRKISDVMNNNAWASVPIFMLKYWFPNFLERKEMLTQKPFDVTYDYDHAYLKVSYDAEVFLTKWVLTNMNPALNFNVDNVERILNSDDSILDPLCESIDSCTISQHPALTSQASSMLESKYNPLASQQNASMKHSTDKQNMPLACSMKSTEKNAPSLHSQNIDLSDEQKAAVLNACKHRVSIITGGPGTGKTSVIKELIRIQRARGINVTLTSFTGKAVSRMREVTGEKSASTMNQLLMMHKGSGKKMGTVIIDEASMVQTKLAAEFIKAFNPDQVIFVGDKDQLEPIGYGSFFEQLLKTNVPCAYLTKMFRTGSAGITSNLTAIRDSVPNTPLALASGENFNIANENISLIGHIYKRLKEMNISPNRVTTVTLYNREMKALNEAIQKIYDNGEDSITFNNIVYRVNDRVMAIKNRYDIGVMNGEEGTIVAVNTSTIDVKFGDNIHRFELVFDTDNYTGSTSTSFGTGSSIRKKDIAVELAEEANQNEALTVDILVHSYAMTVHKSQGSEWDVVIFYIPESTANANFLTKKLIYTALSRSKQQVWCIGKIQDLNNNLTKLPKYRYDNTAFRVGLKEELACTNTEEDFEYGEPDYADIDFECC